MSEPDWLESNGYRVLGLPARAGPKEVHAAAASLRRVASLGLQRPLATDRPGLGVVHRTEIAIQTAVGRLENPAQRLQDRLFWFNCDTAVRASQGDLASDDGLNAHDAALRQLIVAAAADAGDGAVTLWGDALRIWSVALQADTFWDRFQSAEIDANFEPPALPSELDGLRERAISLAGAHPARGLIGGGAGGFHAMQSQPLEAEAGHAFTAAVVWPRLTNGAPIQ